ncbi:hypothetical protein AB4Y45_34380 [Paraburkholderia sp. EG287A]|uniref:hypothetical protein n=1 Tax=Paraburkholderia sp. EG287A TaxID=3237012 RepID=UPI0034D19143
MLLVLAAIAQCLLVALLHWSVARSLFVVGVTLGVAGLSLLGFAWMFVPAAQRPEMLSLFWSVCRQNLRDTGRALCVR